MHVNTFCVQAEKDDNLYKTQLLSKSETTMEEDEDALFSRLSAKADEILSRSDYDLLKSSAAYKSVRFSLTSDLPTDSELHQYLTPWDITDPSLSASNPVFSLSPEEETPTWFENKMSALRSGANFVRHSSPPSRRKLQPRERNTEQVGVAAVEKGDILQVRARSAGRTPVNSLCSTPLDIVERQEQMVEKHQQRAMSASFPQRRSSNLKTSSRLQWLKDIYSGELLGLNTGKPRSRPVTGKCKYANVKQYLYWVSCRN